MTKLANIIFALPLAFLDGIIALQSGTVSKGSAQDA